MKNYLPQAINTGPWINAYSLHYLRNLPVGANYVLPVCAMDLPYEQLVASQRLHLPPLFHEAMSDALRCAMIDRILDCFPVYGDRDSNRRQVEVIEHSDHSRRPAELSLPGTVLAFSVDTAVEEHGPHLPLGTDTIQSYSVLRRLAEDFNQLEIVRPLEYGQLTWGLPFGFSVDLTAGLLTQYVTGYVNALMDARNPQAMYVVDVHGSILHRRAIVEGLKASRCERWAFRWLHEPLAEFASDRGDQHAGGVETALVELVAADLIDQHWFPARETELAESEMKMQLAVELSSDLQAFGNYVREHSSNGIIGSIRNYHALDAQRMFDRMLGLATSDVNSLLEGNADIVDAGKSLW